MTELKNSHAANHHRAGKPSVTSELQPHTDRTQESAKLSQKYQTPELRHLGDVRSLTLGGSLGTGDSGNAGVQRF